MTEAVHLYIYDLSGGLAAGLSQQILGQKIDGIWHTAIVVFGQEYFFGGDGISFVLPCGTVLGEPLKKELLGKTAITKAAFEDTLKKWSNDKFHGSKYNLFTHNCNNFSNEVAKYLVKMEIPSYITSLPSDILNTPFGGFIKPYLDSLSNGIHARPGGTEGHMGSSSNQAKSGSARSLIEPVIHQEPLNEFAHITLTNTKLVYAEEIVQLKSSIETASPDVLDIPIPAMSLIDSIFTDFIGQEEQALIVELYRLLVWKNPESLMVWLSDDSRPIHALIKRWNESDSSKVSRMLIEATVKFISNCVYLSLNWSLSEDVELPLSVFCKLALTVIEDLDLRIYALGLCLNLALHHGLSEEEGVQVGTYLLHLSQTKKAVFQPTAFDCMVSTLCLLMEKYPFLIDLAKAQEFELAQVDNPICKRIRDLMKD